MFVFIFIVVCKFIHRIFLKFLNQGNELHVLQSFSFFGFKNKQIPVNFKRVQAFNSVLNKKSPNKKWKIGNANQIHWIQ